MKNENYSKGGIVYSRGFLEISSSFTSSEPCPVAELVNSQNNTDKVIEVGNSRQDGE